MLHRVLLISIIACGLIVTGCGKKKEEVVQQKSDWEKIGEYTIDFPANVAAAVDQNKVITAGYIGEMYYTEDGAKKWTKATNFSFDRMALEIVSDKIAWTTGKGPRPSVSHDGGKIWDESKSKGFPEEMPLCKFLSAYDAKNAWISTGIELYATSDGGNLWKKITLPADCQKIFALHLENAKTGYIFDSNNVLYKTNNGGAAWEKKQLDIQPLFNKVVIDTAAAALRFIGNKGTLILFKIKDQKEWVVFNTADGGATWQQEKINSMFGAPYLSRDMNILTVYDSTKRISIFKRMK